MHYQYPVFGNMNQHFEDNSEKESRYLFDFQMKYYFDPLLK